MKIRVHPNLLGHGCLYKRMEELVHIGVLDSTEEKYNLSLEVKAKEEEEYREDARSTQRGGSSATSWAIKQNYDFSVTEPY